MTISSIIGFFSSIFLLLSVARGENADFNCTELGTFPKSNTNCTGYIVCYQRNDNEFASIDVTCPEGSVYSEKDEICVDSASYECKDISVSNIAIETDPCNNTEGRFLKKGTECKSYYLCVERDNQIISTLYDCPKGSLFSKKRGRCMAGYECPKEGEPETAEDTTTTITTEATTTITTTTAAVETEPGPCNNEEGRVIKENTECRSYYLCLRKGGKISYTVYQCPNGSLFSTARGQCLRGYECPASNNPTTAAPTTTTTDESSTDIPTTEEPTNEPETGIPPAFRCTRAGNFVNEESKDCSTYIECASENQTGIVAACPDSKKFSYRTLTCETEANCPFSDEDSKACNNEPGRYENKEDKSCKSYVLCVMSKPNPNGDSYIVSKKYACPGKRIFSPKVAFCVDPSQYQCPYEEVTTPAETTVSAEVTTLIPTESVESNSTETPTHSSTAASDSTTVSQTEPISTTSQEDTTLVTDPETTSHNGTSTEPSMTRPTITTSRPTVSPTPTTTPRETEIPGTMPTSTNETTTVSDPEATTITIPPTEGTTSSAAPTTPITITQATTESANWTTTSGSLITTAWPETTTSHEPPCAVDSILNIQTGFYKNPSDVCSYISCINSVTVVYCGKGKCDKGKSYDDKINKCVASDVCN